MIKLRLHLDDLAVETFDTVRMDKARGTVIGAQQLCTCGSCPGQATCDYTCDDATCAATCDDDSCAGGSCLTCSPTCWDTCRVRVCYGTGTSA